ncbi:unnamed protein product [Vitrella brassicaformis CCMP3155]|uniref:Uncharacterized protein n=1 Tax=Vitrella brassicaformis (strain CCMP3155) TaxID=1169540 RepID=A0A0G4EK95_VITBC|nr:unnamed protein product [Vitrella brassicaformis CCMP3155]|eukprot:CEL96952.1 unnamed protein product [Vitrella brassicaformis CCMP3155]
MIDERIFGSRHSSLFLSDFCPFVWGGLSSDGLTACRSLCSAHLSLPDRHTTQVRVRLYQGKCVAVGMGGPE